MLWPLLLIHICSATVGLLSGFMAMGTRKGSSWHGASGTVFFVSMLIMSSSAAYIAAFLKVNAVNMCVGLLTFYLVATAWWTARRREGGTTFFDYAALLYILMVTSALWSFGFEAAGSPRGRKDGMPAFLFFIFGTIALLCAVNDLRMIVRRGLTGPRRIARHLWRMSTALLITTLSFYPGQAKLFPQWLRETPLVFLPHIFLLVMLIYSAVRVRRSRKRVEQVKPMPLDPIATAMAGVTR
ncbi:MAG TPA: hypothetical protein VGF28_20790 [Thermoanaerobaculia bacterium]|jgi:hypothetical protein